MTDQALNLADASEMQKIREAEEAAAKEREAAKANRGFIKVRFHSLRPGDNVFRILPSPRGSSTTAPFRKIRQATIMSPDGKQNSVKLPLDGLTLAHEHVNELRNQEKSEDTAVANAAKKRLRKTYSPRYDHAYIAVRRDVTDKDPTDPALLIMNQALHNQIFAYMCDPDYNGWDHPETGKDIVINFTPAPRDGSGNVVAGGKSQRTFRFKPHSSPLTTDEKQMEEWLSRDYFALSRIEEPTPDDLIQAFIDGTQAEWFAAKKAENAARRAAEEGNTEDLADVQEPGADTVAPQTTVNDAVAKAKAELQKKFAEKG